MRRLLIVAALLLSGNAEAQSCNGCGIGYWYRGVPATGGTMTGPLLLPDGAVAAPSLGFSSQTNTGLYYNSGHIYFGILGNAVIRITTTALYPVLTDQKDLGVATVGFANAFFTRSIQGSKSKAIADNSATNFVDVAIPQTAGSNYAGGRIVYTIFCKDAANQATQSGTVSFACHNLGGTESCGFGTPDGATLGDGTASIGAPAFTAAGGTDVAALSVQSDCTGVTPTTLTIQYRLDMPQPNTVTPK